MRYASAIAFRTALEARLNAERTDAVGISRLRKRVVFERFLARLHESAPGAWVLKGGFALELRLGAHARTTKDIDVDWSVSEEDATELLIDAARLDLEDGFDFAIERAAGEADVGSKGRRWSVTAKVAGREFERVAIDVGFASAPILEPEALVSSRLLAFAGVPAVEVPAIAIEQHVAEKLHAYTRSYARDAPSSRVKDLVDLVVIANTTAPDAVRLRAAIEQIFRQRSTHDAPTALPEAPADWSAPWRRLATNLPADPDVREGHRSAAAFLDPILSSTVVVGRWDPDEQRWQAPSDDEETPGR